MLCCLRQMIDYGVQHNNDVNKRNSQASSSRSSSNNSRVVAGDIHTSTPSPPAPPLPHRSVPPHPPPLQVSTPLHFLESQSRRSAFNSSVADANVDNAINRMRDVHLRSSKDTARWRGEAGKAVSAPPSQPQPQPTSTHHQRRLSPPPQHPQPSTLPSKAHFRTIQPVTATNAAKQQLSTSSATPDGSSKREVTAPTPLPRSLLPPTPLPRTVLPPPRSPPYTRVPW